MFQNAKKRNISALLSVVLLFTTLSGNIAAAAVGETDYTIMDPYDTVDWDSYGQYKANFHMHTYESDGSASPAAMIEEHYRQGYEVIALTDHNFTSTTMDRTDRPAVNSSGNPLTYLTSERLEEITTGIDRDDDSMINIPFSNEQSRSDHLNTFWADFNNESGATLESSIAKAEALGGISHINHPGRYTGGRTTANDGEDGAYLSSEPLTVKKYVDLFEKYTSLVGMEIINKKDGDSFSDRILWDNILKRTMPNRPVWGFSNDDNHSIAATGFSYNMMLMPENTEENVRYSMENGTFYAIALVAKRELGMDFVAEGVAPAIMGIAVDQEENSITIEGSDFEKIEWIADGEVIVTGMTIDLNDHEDKIYNYVRAQLIGDGGIGFTQPFGVTGGQERLPELASATLTAGGNSLNSDAEEGIKLTVEGINDLAEYVDLEDAQIEFKLDPTEILNISENGMVTVKNDPVENQEVNIWVEVTLDAKTVKSNKVSILVTLPGQIVVPVVDGMDDVEEGVSNGSMYMDSSNLEIVKDGSSDQIVGTRFQGVNNPQGAKIIEATIQFTTDETSDKKNTDPFLVDIYGEKTVNSLAFATGAYDLSGRTFTENVVSWKDAPKWETVHEAGTAQQTPNLAVLVQEILDLDGWKEGNALTFRFSGIGVRCAESYEGGGANQGPTLHVKYMTLENQIAGLIDGVEALNINRGNKKSLLVKLNNSSRMVDTRPDAAANMLQAFVNEINAMEQSGKLVRGDALELIKEATETALRM